MADAIELPIGTGGWDEYIAASERAREKAIQTASAIGAADKAIQLEQQSANQLAAIVDRLSSRLDAVAKASLDASKTQEQGFAAAKRAAESATAATEKEQVAIRKAGQESAEATKNLEKSVKGEQLSAVLGQVAEKFDGAAQTAFKFASQVGQAAFAGGPLLAVLSAVGFAAREIDDALKEQDREWEAMRKHAADAAKAEADALKQIGEETKKLAADERVYQLVKSKGLSEGQARAQVALEAIAADRKAGQEHLGDLRAQIAEESRLRDAAIEHLRQLDEQRRHDTRAYHSLDEQERTERDREATEKEIESRRASVAGLKDQQEQFAALMTGGAQKVANAEKTLDLEKQKSGDETVKKNADAKKQRLADDAAFYARLAQIQDEALKKEIEEAEKTRLAIQEGEIDDYTVQAERARKAAEESKKLRDDALDQESKDAFKIQQDRAEAAKKQQEADGEASSQLLNEHLERQAQAYQRIGEVAQQTFQGVGESIGTGIESLAAYALATNDAANANLTLADTAAMAAAGVAKAALDGVASVAGVKTAQYAAEAFAAFGLGDIPGGISLSAASIGWAALGGVAKAAGNGIASAAKPDSSAPARQADRGPSGTSASSYAGGSGGTSRSGGQAPVTVIFQSPVLASRSEVASDLDALLKQAERRR
jgi:hypothetical protein